MSDFWKDYEPEPTRAAPMTTERALDLALEALEESVDLVREDYENAKKLYSNYPSRQARLLGLEDGLSKHEAAITAIKQARALDKKAENARELGLDYEPHKGMSEHLAQVTNGRVRIDPVTGDVGIGTPPAQPAQKVVDCHATGVCVQSGLRAEPAPVQEPVAWICNHHEEGVKNDVDYWQDDIDALPVGTPLYTTPPAQPAVPDAFGTREGEHPQYIQGWNDCRAEMLRGMKP